MKVLYIGGTGEISYECVRASAAEGHDVVVFNRGKTAEPLPDGVREVHGDLADPGAYNALGDETFDVICQFLLYKPADAQRDMETFCGRCGQYVFISSTAIYAKTPSQYLYTEQAELDNPYWDYARDKIDLEKILTAARNDGDLPVTIVRPSHTYRCKFPSTFTFGDDLAWRMLNGRPVIVHGDGTGVWTLTHSRDFARVFVKLLGNHKTIGETYHITLDRAGYTWQRIFEAEAAALGAEPAFVHVPTDTLVGYEPAWEARMVGDKAQPALFDNSKVVAATGVTGQTVSLEEGFTFAAECTLKRLESYRPDEKLHALIDRIAEEQIKLGG